MKNLFNLFLTCLVSIQVLQAQVPKKIVVEHFTNTNCSVCASRNPGFYTNFNNQNNVIHLAIHPSSPYASCVLSKHNAAENDGRTNYYGIYGATPRIVIQGVVVSSGSNYSSATIFTPYLDQTSPASIKIYQTKYGKDSIHSRIVVKTEASHTLTSLRLFVALVEDTLNYTGSNGEPSHFDVFRKSLTGTSGVTVTLPSKVGDSLVYNFSSAANGVWNFSRIYTLAILQDAATKSVIQSENIATKINKVATSLQNTLPNDLYSNIYFYEHTIFVDIEKIHEHLNFEIYDISGRKILEKNIESNREQLNVASMSPGVYLYLIKSDNGFIKTGKILIN
ncbi:MAG: T9SS type A sorting domain-containing protein [bacterium]|nr:T9SS type A sorting domain-containing protein [bacterium]